MFVVHWTPVMMIISYKCEDRMDGKKDAKMCSKVALNPIKTNDDGWTLTIQFNHYTVCDRMWIETCPVCDRGLGIWWSCLQWKSPYCQWNTFTWWSILTWISKSVRYVIQSQTISTHTRSTAIVRSLMCPSRRFGSIGIKSKFIPIKFCIVFCGAY